MTLIVCPDPDSAARLLADAIERAVTVQPRLVLGLATGRTPGRAYRDLVRRQHLDPGLTFRNVTTFNTDEFVGMPPEDPRSARFFMNTNFFRLVDIRLENTHVPRGDAVDLSLECQAYDQLIAARGGLDLVVLGLGHNGHVGFNEPGSSARSRTRIVDFTESTLAALSDGARFANLEQTPSSALTLGMGTILEARHVMLIATGISKAQSVHRMFDGRQGPAVPASLLLGHPKLSVVVDSDAASALRNPGVDIEYV